MDYLAHLLKGKGSEGFLTSSFTSVKLSNAPFALGLIDLPIETEKKHLFKSDEKRGVVITANGNMILFKKQIQESECQIRNDIQVSHLYKSLQEKNQEQAEDNFIINHPYECKIVLTNISQQSKQIDLLCQIPNGSLPLKQTQYVNSNQL